MIKADPQICAIYSINQSCSEHRTLLVSLRTVLWMSKYLIAAGSGKYYAFELTWLKSMKAAGSYQWDLLFKGPLGIKANPDSCCVRTLVRQCLLCAGRAGMLNRAGFFSQINVEPCPRASFFSATQMWSFLWFHQFVVRLLIEWALVQIIIWCSGYNYGYSDFHFPLLITQHAIQNMFGTDTWAASAKCASA